MTGKGERDGERLALRECAPEILAARPEVRRRAESSMDPPAGGAGWSVALFVMGVLWTVCSLLNLVKQLVERAG